MIVVAVNVHARLLELVEAARVTVPAEPLSEDTVTVELPASPAFTVTLVGLVERAKSWTWNVTVTECDRLPLVPVTLAR
jgi:hypothetical protein